jgi:hydrogenase nickel incorporation protein HypA/HybF
VHEYSIVLSLLESCEEHIKVHNASKVTKLVVKIGVLSGVEPELLQRAFDTFKEESVCHDALLDLHVQKVLIACNGCSEESILESLEFQCPRCGSHDISIKDGEEMYLMQLELE